MFTLTKIQPQVSLLIMAMNYIYCCFGILLNLLFFVNIGSTIFISNETNSLRKVWSVTSMEPRVALTFVKKTYQLVLLSEEDLDVTNVRYYFEFEIY